MADTAVKIKIMPENQETNLAELEEKAKKKIESLGGKLNSSEKEPIAFGLNALILTIVWPEEKDTGMLEEQLSGVEGVSSTQIIDYRRLL